MLLAACGQRMSAVVRTHSNAFRDFRSHRRSQRARALPYAGSGRSSRRMVIATAAREWIPSFVSTRSL